MKLSKLLAGACFAANATALFCISSHAAAWISVPANATKIFDAGFSGASITHYPQANNYSYRGSIYGGSWGASIPSQFPYSREESWFNYLVKPPKPLGDYIANYIGTDTMPWGPYPTPVQVLRVKQDDPELDCDSPLNPCMSRIQYNWFPETSVKDIYVEYYIKLQDDLLQVMPDQGVPMWRSLMEFAEKPLPGSSQYLRAELTINRKPDGQGHYNIGWLGNVSYIPGFASVPNGYLFNTTTPIPQGKWFLLTVHYKLHETNGAFEAGIRLCADGGGFEGNQQELFSFKNIKTATGDTSINVANIMKAYAGSNVLANGQVWQHIYNTTVWVVF